MKEAISLRSLVDDVIELVKTESKGNQSKIRLSKETASLLLSVGEEQAPPVAATEATPRTEDIEETRKTAAAQCQTSHDAEKSVSPQTPSIWAEQPDMSLPESDLDAPPAEAGVESADDLALVADEVARCEKCPLGTQRTRPVPGEGNPRATLVFVGEAPGMEEDRTGRPFVGRAGNLLTDIIVKGMNMKREDVFICNVLKCRPPNNRTPNPEEVAQCEPYLLRQIAAIRPKVICALGATAAQTLLKTNTPIKRLRGVWFNYHGIPFRVTYHPAYLLRNPPDKRKTWEDIQEIMRVLSGEVVPEL